MDKHDIKMRIKKIKELNRVFEHNRYNGSGKESFEFIEGNIPILISAPHAVNHFRNGAVKYADKLTGGLAKFLHNETGCHVIFSSKYSESDPNFDLESDYKAKLAKYIFDHNIELVIDLHGSSKDKPYAIELGTVPNSLCENSSLKGNDFVEILINYAFEYEFRTKNFDRVKITKNTIFDAGHQNTVTKFVAENTNAASVQLEINGIFRDISYQEELYCLSETLKNIVNVLGYINWEDSKKIEVYKLRQSSKHKPQDVVSVEYKSNFLSGSNIGIMSYIGMYDDARVVVNATNNNLKSEYIYLTNRLIENVAGEEWSNQGECNIKDMPIILYNNCYEYPIGLPKANQINTVAFSSVLYDKNKSEKDKYDFILYNKFNDARLYLNFDQLDYGDNGRVKDKHGNPAEKVMVPRYYKKLLGYMDYPLKMIRTEEYRLSFELLSDRDKQLFNMFYEEVKGENYYVLKGMEILNNYNDELDELINVQRKIGCFDSVGIVKIPKMKNSGIKTNFLSKHRFMEKLLDKVIGKADFYLKSEWTSETDDRNNVARLNSNMMSLLGVSENDKIEIIFGETIVKTRVLINNDIDDYQICLPAPARKKLGENNINDIVVVHRDMLYTFLRHSEEQVIAILGTVLAVFEVVDIFWVGALICLIFTPLILYFVLNEERIKVK